MGSTNLGEPSKQGSPASPSMTIARIFKEPVENVFSLIEEEE